MKRREKQRAKVEFEDDDAQDNNTASNPVIIVSSDDEDANEDLSLKIVQKALLMCVGKLVPNDEVLDEPTTARGSGCDGGLVASSLRQAESVVVLDDDALGETSGIVASEVSEVDNGEVKMSRRKNKKLKKVDTGEGSVIVAEEKEIVQTIKCTDKIEFDEASTVQMGKNIVLQKLLLPRYFDPPDSGWRTCYSCGEEGHAAVNCTAAKRKKPCFVCGSLKHKSKQCNMAEDCFICKKRGHQAKDCPEKYKGGSKSSTICLKCGDSGHDMFSCKNNYSWDDIKEIQCYVCKRFGHLCCVSLDDDRPREVSCYKCGRLGHTGLTHHLKHRLHRVILCCCPCFYKAKGVEECQIHPRQVEGS